MLRRGDRRRTVRRCQMGFVSDCHHCSSPDYLTSSWLLTKHCWMQSVDRSGLLERPRKEQRTCSEEESAGSVAQKGLR